MSDLTPPCTPSKVSWYAPWLSEAHAVYFNAHSALDDRNLMRLYETLNDVRLLKERLDQGRVYSLLEVGCATGDFSRYLKLTFPRVLYHGLDISQPAIQQAKRKYPRIPFAVRAPEQELFSVCQEAWGRNQFDVVFSADVFHHQPEPLAFLSELFSMGSHMVIFRCRTRDKGKTQWDWTFSRQFHYGAWVPYLVVNLEELIQFIQSLSKNCELVIYRSHTVLGNRNDRQLPEDCSFPSTGTAETAVGIFLTSNSPGKVTLINRWDNRPNTTWDHKLRSLWKRRLGLFRQERSGVE